MDFLCQMAVLNFYLLKCLNFIRPNLTQKPKIDGYTLISSVISVRYKEAFVEYMIFAKTNYINKISPACIQ